MEAELARDGGGSACINAECTAAFASRLPHRFLAVYKISVHRRSLWERACSRKRWVSLHQHWMCRRLREQARSHIGFWPFIRSASTPDPCGSGLARESGGSVCISIGCAAVFASKLAPTMACGEHKTHGHPESPVGASLLAMRSAHPTSPQTDPTPSRASPLPQEERGLHQEPGRLLGRLAVDVDLRRPVNHAG